MFDIAAFFGQLLSICYRLTGNYILAIVLFTVVTKVFAAPVSIWTQYNSIKMMQMQSGLNQIRIRYFGDPDRIADETALLYRREKYSPFAGMVPLILQIILLLAVIAVVRDPACAGLAPADLSMGKVRFDACPYQDGRWYLLMPILTGGSSLALGMVQNQANAVQAQQPFLGKLATITASIGISVVLGMFVPTGVGCYWICSNLLTIVQQILLNRLIDPYQKVDRKALEESQKQLEELHRLGSGRKRFGKNVYAAREKADYKRFFSVANKHLVFYSESSGFYKYFETVIDYILEYSNLTIHYVTSDPDDRIFAKAEKNSQIRGYYIGEKRLIPLMMRMDADLVVMTVPDLENYHIKRSYVKPDVEYIFMFHWCTSVHMVIREKALDHFDTVFCPGRYQMDEIRYSEKIYGLPAKNLIETGYGPIEMLADAYEKMEKQDKERYQILIAPSHQEGNLMDEGIDTLLCQLLHQGYQILVRPHPQYIRRNPQKITEFMQKYDKDIRQGAFVFQTDFSSAQSVYESDLVITDWSTIAYEFAFATLKPVLWINTPMKVINPHYTEYPMKPLDLTLRSRIGQFLAVDELKQAAAAVKKMLEQTGWQEQIREIRHDIMPEFGSSGRIGGKYILNRLIQKKKEREPSNEKCGDTCSRKI